MVRDLEFFEVREAESEVQPYIVLEQSEDWRDMCR